MTQQADAILELLGLGGVRDRRVGNLPYGTLKLLELGCALATDPALLLLDEPSSGMGPEESHELGDRLLALRQELGVTMLLIEHHVPLVAAICDYVYVLNFGRLLAEGDAEHVRSHPEVVAAYLGGEAPEALAETADESRSVVAAAPAATTTAKRAARHAEPAKRSTGTTKTTPRKRTSRPKESG
jgi:branched-chain amino acid transport system ATP-binding protein